jgi:phosphomevalonate kinase
LTVRVSSGEAQRAKRGWVFTPGVDDAASECALDSAAFDLTLFNNGDGIITPQLQDQLDDLVRDLQAVLREGR